MKDAIKYFYLKTFHKSYLASLLFDTMSNANYYLFQKIIKLENFINEDTNE